MAWEFTAGRHRSAEALVTQPPVESRHGLPVAVDRPTIVALDLVGQAQALVRQGVGHDLPTGCGKRKGALASCDGLVRRAPLEEMA